MHPREHIGENPFVCSICNAGFKDNTNLKVHLETHPQMHTGEKL